VPALDPSPDVPRGDRAAFDHHWSQHEGYFYGWFLRVTGSRVRAEDLVGDLSLVMWRIAGREPIQSFKALGCSIGIHLVRRTPPPRLPDGFPHPPHRPQPDEDLRQRELESAIRDFIDQLHGDPRTIAVLSFVELLPSDDVIRLTGMSPHKVNSIRYRVRKQLREWIEEKGLI